MADIKELESAFLSAHRAGDTKSAQALADAIRTMQAQPKASSIADTVMGVGRQIGLTGRAALEGVPAVADIAWNPVRNAVSWASGTPLMPSMEEGGRTIADMIGLPTPQTSNERIAQQGAKMMAGAGGTVGLLSKGAKVAGETAGGVMSAMTQRPMIQAAAAGGGATVGEAAKEGGASKLGQFGATVLGSLGSAFGANAAQGLGKSLVSAAKGMGQQPMSIDIVLAQELKRAGVDWDGMSNAAKAALREDAGKFLMNGQKLDSQALGRLADFRQVPGSTPLLGDITQNPRTLTIQRNLAKQQANMPQLFGATDLADTTNTNAKAVLGSLGRVADSSLDGVQTGQGLLSMAQGKDAAFSAAENALYKTARDAAGRDIPLARGAFVQEAFGNLARENKMASLPADIAERLNNISAGQIKVGGQVYEVPFTADSIDSLKTALANAHRSGDGNQRAAIKSVRDALDNVTLEPVKRTAGGGQMVTEGGAGYLQQQDALPQASLAAWDAARAQARQRRQWQESAPWIEDAIGGADPIKFVQKHVVGGTLDSLRSMRAEIGADDAMLQAVRKQMIDYIMKRGSADVSHTNFSSKGMQDAMDALTPQRMGLFFAPEEMQQIRAAINVGRHMQAQPIGSAVNNSNSGALLLGRLSSALTAGSSIPALGPLVAAPLNQGLAGLQMRGMMNPARGLLADEAPQTLRPALMGSSLLIGRP